MFTFKVIPDDGEPFIVKAGTRDVLYWEKTNRGKTYAGLIGDPNLVDYYTIAHTAAWRQGLYTGTREEFEKTHEIDLAYDEPADEEPDPTLPGPSTGPSSSSPSEPGSPSRSGRSKTRKD